MFFILRFILGLAIGSFLNVVALRYDPKHPLFSKSSIGGRSRCPGCGRTLAWFDLIPLVSFLLLKGKCRTCHAPISWRYFLVELGFGLLFLVNLPLSPEFLLHPEALLAWRVVWMAAFAVLGLMALIDARFRIIPDEVHAMLLGLGIINIFLLKAALAHGSFIPDYALLFGLHGSIWLNHAMAAFSGSLFFLALILVTRGRGMGMGDAKLALSLGFLFGWPDVWLIIFMAFVIGAAVGGLLLLGKGRFKQAVPFGPFLGIAALLTALFGNQILRGYFSLFGW